VLTEKEIKMQIKEFAEAFIKAEEEAWQQGNFDALEQLHDPNAIYHYMTLGREMEGWEAYKRYIMGGRQAISGLRQEWQYLTGQGNYFALSYKWRGMFTSQAPGMPVPTGKEATANYLFLLRLNKGRIAEAWYNGIVTGLT
jgi:hypothetical protein